LQLQPQLLELLLELPLEPLWRIQRELKP